jgi:hypothetical protein
MYKKHVQKKQPFFCVFIFFRVQKIRAPEKTSMKNKHEKQRCRKNKLAKNTGAENNGFILCFYFFSRAENNREKQAYRKNKPVQKIRAPRKTSVQKKTTAKNTIRKNILQFIELSGVTVMNL